MTAGTAARHERAAGRRPVGCGRAPDELRELMGIKGQCSLAFYAFTFSLPTPLSFLLAHLVPLANITMLQSKTMNPAILALAIGMGLGLAMAAPGVSDKSPNYHATGVKLAPQDAQPFKLESSQYNSVKPDQPYGYL